MARRQEQLVEAIRARRGSLGRDLSALLALQPMRAWVRQRPLTWIVGGGISGYLAARFLVRPTWRRRRSLARGWIRGHLRESFLHLVVLGLREGSRQATATGSSVSAAAASGVQAPQSAVSPHRQSGPGRSESAPDASSPQLERAS